MNFIIYKFIRRWLSHSQVGLNKCTFTISRELRATSWVQMGDGHGAVPHCTDLGSALRALRGQGLKVLQIPFRDLEMLFMLLDEAPVPNPVSCSVGWQKEVKQQRHIACSLVRGQLMWHNCIAAKPLDVIHNCSPWSTRISNPTKIEAFSATQVPWSSALSILGKETGHPPVGQWLLDGVISVPHDFKHNPFPLILTPPPPQVVFIIRWYLLLGDPSGPY